MIRRLLISIVILVAMAASVAKAVAAVAPGAAKSPTPSTHGDLRLSASRSDAIFSMRNMAIGDTAAGSLTLTKEGDAAGSYRLRATTSGSALLASRLVLTVYEGGSAGPALYRGPLDGAASVDLGRFASGPETQTYSLQISLPSSGSSVQDNALQGLSSQATFSWDADED